MHLFIYILFLAVSIPTSSADANHVTITRLLIVISSISHSLTAGTGPHTGKERHNPNDHKYEL